MYIIPETKKVLKTQFDIRKHFSYMSFPTVLTEEIISDLGLNPIVNTNKPEFNRFTHKVVEIDPVETNDTWYQTWELVELTIEEISQQLEILQQEVVAQTQQRLDDFARTRNYDGIMSLCTYVNSSVEKFKTEAEYGIEVRDQTWATLYQILDEVNNQEREIPSSFSDIEDELPSLNWPEI